MKTKKCRKKLIASLRHASNAAKTHNSLLNQVFERIQLGYVTRPIVGKLMKKLALQAQEKCGLKVITLAQ
jgi:hypothetical protein